MPSQSEETSETLPVIKDLSRETPGIFFETWQFSTDYPFVGLKAYENGTALLKLDTYQSKPLDEELCNEFDRADSLASLSLTIGAIVGLVALI